MRIYISGPMTGIPEWNFPAFDKAAEHLSLAGHVPVNPADGGHELGRPWESYLREDIRLLIDCQAVATLPGWTASRGACLEVHIAHKLRIPVRPLHEWLALADRVAGQSLARRAS